MPGDSFSILVLRTVAGLCLALFGAWTFFRVDQETMRLFKLSKLYGLTENDDETERKKIRKRLVIGYSLSLTIITGITLYMGFQIWTRVWE